MNYYANDEQRVRLVAGLRDLADFLDQNPDVPVPWRADLLVFPPEASDAEMFAEIDTIAELIGSTASDADSPRGHYSAVRDFGPVQYRAIAIPYNARDKGANSDDGLPYSRFSRFHGRRVRSRFARRHHRHTPRRSP